MNKVAALAATAMFTLPIVVNAQTAGQSGVTRVEAVASSHVPAIQALPLVAPAANSRTVSADADNQKTVSDDEDSGMLPTIVAALQPKCTALTASPASVNAGAPFQLNLLNCAFRGNLSREYVWAGAGIPFAAVTGTSFFNVAAAPIVPGTYSYTAAAWNGEIPGKLHTLQLTVNPLAPAGCALTGPVSLAANQSGSFTVACSSGSQPLSYSWSRSPAGLTSNLQSVTDTPFTGAAPASAIYNVTVSNAAGAQTLSRSVINTSANVAPDIGQFALVGASTVLSGSPVSFNFTVSDLDPGQTLTVRLVRVADAAVVASTTVTSGNAQSGTLTWSATGPIGNTTFRLEVFDGYVTRASSNTFTINVANEVLTFLHPNVTGSPIMATDASGAVLWREDYQAYGERIRKESGSTIASGSNPATAPAANNRAWFTGKLHDETTGLSYFGARYYDPQVGRFMGFDPVGFDEHSPLSFNRYAYANNNPLKFVDPDGRQAMQAIVAGGAAIALSTMAPSAGKGEGVRAGGIAPTDPTHGIRANPIQAPTAAQIMSFPIAQTLLSPLGFPIAVAEWMSNIVTANRHDDRGGRGKGGAKGLGVSKPDDAPPGTIGLDDAARKYGWNTTVSHKIKDSATDRLGKPTTWVGVTPDIRVGVNRDGKWSDEGTAEDAKQ